MRRPLRVPPHGAAAKAVRRLSVAAPTCRKRVAAPRGTGDELNKLNRLHDTVLFS
ncbi:hypothetical protein [Lonsdalea quercina]|uniref:hypothetical protein n=1 Tax=Lonsdalea quercina TaxID=71657 RepID=UPI003975DA1B